MDNNYIKRSDQGQNDCVSVPWHEMEKMGIKRDDPMAVQRLLQMYDELKQTNKRQEESKKKQEETKKHLQSDLDTAKNEKEKVEKFLQKMLTGCAEIRNELQEKINHWRIISAVLIAVIVCILFHKTFVHI